MNNDIFKNDELQREWYVNQIIDFIRTFANKSFIATLNGKFGSGKTTLFDFLMKTIGDEFTVIRYDCWENNFFENPIIPLLYSFNDIKTEKQKLKEVAKKVIKNIPKMLIATLSNKTGIEITPDNISIFDDFDSYKTAIEEYKKVLEEVGKDKNIILLVDEIDRCLPAYQIKILETIHHLLNINNLSIIIAVDKDQLEKSIESMYGNNTNIYGYLSKFIDYEFELPNVNDDQYIKKIFEGNYDEYYHNIFINIYNSLDLQLRDKIKITKEFNLIIKSIEKNNYGWLYLLFAFILLILKRFDGYIYKKYFTNISNNSYYDLKIYQQTNGYKFINELSNSRCKGIIQFIIDAPKNTEEKDFIFYLINYFDNIKNIKNLELLESPTRTKEIIDYFKRNIHDNRYINIFNKIINIVNVI